jgi:ABC-type multidrug transport system fused ATPase/permease subunit
MTARARKTPTLWRLFVMFKPRRFQYVISMVIVAAIFAGERMFTGWVVLLFTDAIATKDMSQLWNAVIYWALFALGMVIFSPVFLYAWRSSIVRGMASIRQAVFSHMQRLPLSYYESRHSGEAMSILSNDITTAEQAFQSHLFDFVKYSLQGIGAIIFMLILKWDLALIIILGGLVPLVINVVAARRLRLIGQESQGKLAILSERLSDLLAGFQVVRTFSLGDWIFKRFTRGNQEVLDTNLKRVGIESSLAAANELGGIATLVSFIIGGYMVLDQQTTLGVLFGMIQLNNPIQNFFYQIGGIISRIQVSLAAGDRILAVLDAAPEPNYFPLVGSEAAAPEKNYFSLPATGPAALPAPAERLPATVCGIQESNLSQKPFLAFDDVRFSYDDGRPVLQGVSFEVRAGQVAALVGSSGSGKSTVFRLLMGHYPVSQGAVTIFDRLIQDYALYDLRELFAFVPQDAYLYSGTILDNIRYGKPDASEADIIAAARTSYADEFIQQLPQGYQTLVGERGAHLSGGQRQRVAIARALLKDAPVLLLDEATSALDSESEEFVQQALNALMKGRTTIAIAHRLSTIEHADVIYVLDNGRIVEQGRHADLLENGALYSYLYNLQFNDLTQPASNLKT